MTENQDDKTTVKHLAWTFVGFVVLVRRRLFVGRLLVNVVVFIRHRMLSSLDRYSPF